MNDQVADERSIFLRAIEITSAEGRSSFLDAACGDNQRLRDEIEALLGAHERPLGLLDVPDLVRPTVDMPAAYEGPGTVVGPYKLLQAIGEGGMGTVFMAEQTDPVRRFVALKLIKAGMDGRQVLARFVPVPYCYDWVECQVLYREAHRLIERSDPPEDPRLLVVRGRAFAALGRGDRAEAEFARALRLAPDDAKIRGAVCTRPEAHGHD